MGWTQVYTTGYSRLDLNEPFATYKNTSSSTVVITALTAYLGVAGNGVRYYGYGNDLTGNGKSLSVSMTCGSSSAGFTVTKTVGRTSGSNGYYPTTSECSSATFVFNKPIRVSPGDTITINIVVSNTNNSLLICQEKLSHQEGRLNTVWVCTSDGWKEAIPWVCTSDGWKEA
jgi:hypothetical protein